VQLAPSEASLHPQSGASALRECRSAIRAGADGLTRRGCHTWSFDGGAYKASLKIAVARGATLKVIDNDIMPHKLVQLAGPKAKLVSPAMRQMSAQAKVTFPKKGTYRFTTRAGEDYPNMSMMKTIGEDHVLRLTVVVS
jgi:hypothetical protein